MIDAPAAEPRPRVHLLPEDLANQIAAGEVVERPASVVKELIENALDAGARRVRVDVAHGGEELIRVADDGAGMDREDARLAVLRHATSKIAVFDDLRAIHSFGFRGEALPSIASVSRFELRTRRAGDSEGTLVRVTGGAPAEVAPCGSATGTSVEVRELFYNVPARRKFLKSIATESARVSEVVEAAALAEPEVTMILSRDGKVVAEWLRAASREERVRATFRGEELATCRGERGPLEVEAYLSRPERARNGAVALSMFVNGRPVRDKTLARSIALAYGSVLEAGRYPVGAVYLDLPHELVDVNVHPQKAEVRFADGRAVSDALYKIVAEAVSSAFGLPDPGGYRGKKQKLFDEPSGPSAASWIFDGGPGMAASSPPFAPSAPALADEPRTAAPPSATTSASPRAPAGAFPLPPDPVLATAREPLAVDHRYAGNLPRSAPPAPSLLGDTSHPTASPAAASPAADATPIVPYTTGERPVVFGALRFVAQVRSTFLICEGADGMYFLDQHAAAERVTFHRLRKGFDARDVAAQKLLFPEVLTVTASEVAIVEERQDEIARTGLDVRAAGATELAVHAIPSILGRASPERLVRDLLGEISHAGERAFSGAIDRAIATMACHGSVRAGDPVAPEEARALLASLDEVDFAGHCPHGRPVVMRIGWGELEHRVGRR